MMMMMMVMMMIRQGRFKVATDGPMVGKADQGGRDVVAGWLGWAGMGGIDDDDDDDDSDVGGDNLLAGCLGR